MAEEVRLITVKNVSPEAIDEPWDGVVYRLDPGQVLTMVYGLGLVFRERHPNAIEVVSESFGVAPNVVRHERQVLNLEDEEVKVIWDGIPYVFGPGMAMNVDRELAPTLIAQARIPSPNFPKGAKLAYADEVQLPKGSGTPPHEAGAAEPASAPKKKRPARKPAA